MSEGKCPRCGHEKTVSGIALDGVDHWNCGAYREESGNIYESELCETRQELRSEKAAKEKAEAELAESDRVLAIHKRDYEAHFKAHQEELAKREKALEESLFVIGAILAVYHLQFAGEEVEREIAMAAGSEAVIQQADMVPHLAEWLKQRGKS